MNASAIKNSEFIELDSKALKIKNSYKASSLPSEIQEISRNTDAVKKLPKNVDTQVVSNKTDDELVRDMFVMKGATRSGLIEKRNSSRIEIETADDCQGLNNPVYSNDKQQ